MKTPFTKDQFMAVFTHYNLDVYPMQLILYIIALAAIYFSVKPVRNSGIVISVVLSFLWLWMGVVYHIDYFTSINPAAYLFGALFIVQGILFFISGVIRSSLSYNFRPDKYGTTGLLLILYGLAIYPILGY